MSSITSRVAVHERFRQIIDPPTGHRRTSLLSEDEQIHTRVCLGEPVDRSGDESQIPGWQLYLHIVTDGIEGFAANTVNHLEFLD